MYTLIIIVRFQFCTNNLFSLSWTCVPTWRGIKLIKRFFLFGYIWNLFRFLICIVGRDGRRDRGTQFEGLRTRRTVSSAPFYFSAAKIIVSRVPANTFNAKISFKFPSFRLLSRPIEHNATPRFELANPQLAVRIRIISILVISTSFFWFCASNTYNKKKSNYSN